MAKKQKSKLRLAVIAAAVVAAFLFAVQGGEYGTTDLVRQRARTTRLQAELDSLQRDVDSLKKYRKAVETDPKTQERIAREEFGMIRDKEILYRFVDSLP
jgi:cell division protein FtsB